MVRDPTLDIDWVRAYDRSRDEPDNFIAEVTNEDVGGIEPRGFQDNTVHSISKELVEEHSPSKVIVKGNVIATNELAAKGRLEREISIANLQSVSGMAQRTDVQIIGEPERHGAIFDKDRIDTLLEGTPAEEIATTKKFEFFSIRSF